MSYEYQEYAKELLIENIEISRSIIGMAIIFPNEEVKINLKYVNENLSRLNKIFKNFKSKIPEDDLGKGWKKDINFLRKKIKNYVKRIEDINSNFKDDEVKKLIDNLYNFSVINNSHIASMSKYAELIKGGVDGFFQLQFETLKNTLIALYKIRKEKGEKVILNDKDPEMTAYYEDYLLKFLENYGHIPLTEYIQKFFGSEEELESMIKERDKSEYNFYADGGNGYKIDQTFFTLKLKGFSVYVRNSHNIVDVVKSFKTVCRPEITTRKLKRELIR